MTKCDFCRYSANKNGVLVCPWGWRGCRLTGEEHNEILKLILEVKK